MTASREGFCSLEKKALEMGKKRAIVLDASAFISGFDPLSVEDEQYSVPSVRHELPEDSLPSLRFDTACERERLRLIHPDPHFLDEVKNLSKEAGDLRFLSEADMQILGLAMQLKKDGRDPLIVTDDYSIQNMAKKIGVDFAPLITFGIRFYFKWLLYCPACHKKYPPDYRSRKCEVCGTILKRKPLTKIPAR